MQHAVVGLLISGFVSGCLNVGPGSAGTRSCEQLGWSCGVDDTGLACGSCFAPQVCSVGSCVEPGARVIASGATAFALAGGYAGVLFSLPSRATVRFTASSAGLFQVGIFSLSDWNVFVSGQQSGAFVLSNPTPSTSEVINLGAGTYTFGFRCANPVEACTIRYSLNATY